MSKSDEEFRLALQGKKIPILPLDNKWYKLLSGLEKSDHMAEVEENLKDLLKAQGRITNECKTIRKQKTKLMDEIVAAMDTPDSASVQEKNKKLIEQLNQRLDENQDKLLDFPKAINDANFELMIETMEMCYSVIQENTQDIDEITSWLNEIRVELKKKVVIRQDMEMRNQDMYSYMHDIFGPEVIDLFDLQYNPERDHIVKKEEN